MMIKVEFIEVTKIRYEAEVEVPDDFPLKDRHELFDLILESQLNNEWNEDRHSVNSDLHRIRATKLPERPAVAA
jgi:hypothetical protein